MNANVNSVLIWVVTKANRHEVKVTLRTNCCQSP
jgi:hypothetical protein